MKNFKFLTLFIFVIVFTVSSCDLLGGVLPDDDTNTDNNTHDLPGDVLEKNKTYSMSIDAFNGDLIDGDYYFFIAGNGDHTISLTNLTTDVDFELYEWDGTQNIDDILFEYDESPFYLDESGEDGLVSETISTSSLTSGEPYFIFIAEYNEIDGTYDLLISNP